MTFALNNPYNPREAAFETLMHVFYEGAYLNIALKNVMGKYKLKPVDKAFCTALSEGVVERKRTLDFVRGRFTDFPEKNMQDKTIVLLRMGLYQMLYMNVPVFASCNETVDVASKVCSKKAVGFINGILRSACAKKDELLALIETASPEIKFSVSDDVYNVLLSQLGDRTEYALSQFMEKQALTLRANTLKITRDDLIKKIGGCALPLEKNGIAAFDNASELIRRMGAEYYIQGLSSQRAVSFLDAKPGETIIDVCACPGGKSLGAAIDMQNKGRVISLDIHENKLSLITKSALALGVSIIETHKCDGAKPLETLFGTADRVICDVPCSGLGSIGKRPEIRYKNMSAINSLCETQEKILCASANYLKCGGTLVYSVCTLNEKENDSVVKSFLEKRNDFTACHIETILPDKNGYDGFFIAVLRKQ